jgi:hypothetical protein
MAYKVSSNKKDGVSHGGWKTTEGFFVILHLFLFEIQTSPSKIVEIIEITMMITRCGQMVNDKRQPIPTTFIDTLFKIVSGRGLVTVEITVLRTASSDF